MLKVKLEVKLIYILENTLYVMGPDKQEIILDLKIFFTRSQISLEVLKNLEKEIQVPSFLAKKLNKHTSAISRILLNFEKRNLAKCINSETNKFRKYQITEFGKEVLKEIEK